MVPVFLIKCLFKYFDFFIFRQELRNWEIILFGDNLKLSTKLFYF